MSFDPEETIAPPSGSPRPRLTLTGLQSGHGQRSWTIERDVTVIGREPGPEGIFLDEPAVSRRHARIIWENGGYVYYDENPKNPTLFNGQPIQSPHRLADGQRLLVGHVEITVRLS
jgi:pSer/pThr/pTyr-binding forkhead associated (FHA) protein